MRIHASPAENVRNLLKHGTKKVRFYRSFDWMDAHRIMLGLAEAYPELVTLQNAQDEYGLAVAGGMQDCPLDDDFTRRILKLDEKYVLMGKRNESHARKLEQNEPGCKNWFLTIEDHEAHYAKSESKKRLPTLLMSGTVHGNERVGTTAVLEYAALLLEAANCESFPHEDYPGPQAPQIVMDEWLDQVDQANACRQDLHHRGIVDDERKWLARLATTRRIIIVPAANSLGFFRGEREEDGIDPNKDFPFDLKGDEDTKCMETITARTLNEIFINNIIQLAITFHSGASVVAYNWGAPSFDGRTCPDDTSMAQVSRVYQRFGGPLKYWKQGVYKVGTMNDLVYPVRGGMEDWAYAASWAKDFSKGCQPETYKGYAASQTQYNDSVLRTVNILVETSKEKDPPITQLGADYLLFDPSWQKMGSGHITRNIRVLSAMTDLVQPYLSIVGVNRKLLDDDVVPGKRRDDRACTKTKLVGVKGHGAIGINWIVGGGINIAQTGVIYAPWNIIPDDIDGENQPTGRGLEELLKTIIGEDGADPRIKTSGVSIGRTRWHTQGPYPPPLKNKYTGLLGQPLFTTRFKLNDYKDGEKIAVFAYAQLDQAWGNELTNSTVNPALPPQSHLANARTNTDWKHEYVNQIVEGRKFWFSTPVTIEVRKSGNKVIDLAWRLPSESRLKRWEEKMEEEISEYPVVFSFIVIMIFAVGAGIVIHRFEKRKKRKRMFREISTEVDGMELNDYDDYGDTSIRPSGIPNHTID